MKLISIGLYNKILVKQYINETTDFLRKVKERRNANDTQRKNIKCVISEEFLPFLAK